MSLAQQLSSLKVSATSTFDTNVKNRKSLFFKDSASISRSDAFAICKEGFNNLCELDKRFSQFESLYLEKDIDQPVGLLEEHELNDLKEKIKRFLYMSTEFLDVKFTLQALEWLIFKHEAHLHQPEDVLIACLPLHERKVFVKFAHLFNLEKKEFSWLSNVVDSGKGIDKLELSVICLKNPHILEMICGWPAMILSTTNNDIRSGRHMYRTILALGINVLDKIKLRSFEKIEKYMTPFVRVINDGFKSQNSDFISTVSLLLVYMSHNIRINEDFLKDCIKRLLKTKLLKSYVSIRTVFDIISSQDFIIPTKIDNLLKQKISTLNEEESKVMEKFMTVIYPENEDTTIKMEVSDLEIKNEPKSEPHIQKDRTDDEIVSEATSFKIDWTDKKLEENLCTIFNKYILTWCEAKNERISTKISLEVLQKLRKGPKDVSLAYKSGSLTSLICVALMCPNEEVRKNAKKLLPKLISDWPQMNVLLNISKSDLKNNPSFFTQGNVALTLLSEINPICLPDASQTVRSVALTLINRHTIATLPSLDNIWSTFLFNLSPNKLNINTSMSFIALQSLSQLKESFLTIPILYQHSLIDSITTGLDSSVELISNATTTLGQVNMSLENVKYLLREVNPPVAKLSSKKASIKKFSSSDENDDDIFGETVRYKIIVTLGALSTLNSISAMEQIELIQPLFAILRKTFKSTNNEQNMKEDIIYMLLNLMSALLNILSSVETVLVEDVRQSLSLKIRIEDISKCLYMFKDANLHNIILMVVKKLVKLELGLTHFNLTYFMNWVGSNIIQRDDQHSLSIMNSVLEEILSVCIKIKQKSENVSNDQVKIIASFVKDCSGLPKHRVLMLYYNLIKSLSSSSVSSSTQDDTSSSALWIQLIFMVVAKPVAMKPNADKSVANACLILPLLNKFSKEEQLRSMKKVMCFLTYILNEPGKKRRLINDDDDDDMEVSGSPIQKRRKTLASTRLTVGINKIKKETTTIGSMVSSNDDFSSVKDHLDTIDKSLDPAYLLKTMLSYFQMLFSDESVNVMATVPHQVLTNLIVSMFSCIRSITSTQTKCDAQIKNDIAVRMRRIVESVGASLPEEDYLTLIVTILQSPSDDESVKTKAMELLSSKLSTMSISSSRTRPGSPLSDLVTSIMTICDKVVQHKPISCNMWDFAVTSVTSIVSNGFQDTQIPELSASVFNTLLATLDRDLHIISHEKVVLANLFFKKYIASPGENGAKDLDQVFQASVKVMNKCLQNKQLSNGELESTLAVMHAIVSRDDVHESVTWTSLESLLVTVFNLTALECVIRKMSKSSMEYQKNIRTRISRTSDTRGLVQTCTHLYDEGCSRKSLVFVSGSISLLVGHLANLNKNKMKWNLDEDELEEEMWNLVVRAMKVSENMDGTQKKEEVVLCEEVSLKVVSQLCLLVDYDQRLLTKIILWTDETGSPNMYLSRKSILYRLIRHIASSKVGNKEKTLELVNESSCLGFATLFLKHVSSSTQTKAKRRRKMETSTYSSTIPFTLDQLTSCALDGCISLVDSILRALETHFTLEQKMHMNLSVTDDSIELVSAVCGALVSLDSFMPLDQYRTLADQVLTPLIRLLAVSSQGDESLLTPLCMALCRSFSGISSSALLMVLKTLDSIKDVLGASFDSGIRDHVASFLEDCKLHDDETISEIASQI